MKPEYIAQDNPAAAQLVVHRIVAAIKLLSENPALGHPGRIPGTRELVVPNTRYIVPYRVNPEIRPLKFCAYFTPHAGCLSAGSCGCGHTAAKS